MAFPIFQIFSVPNLSNLIGLAVKQTESVRSAYFKIFSINCLLSTYYKIESIAFLSFKNEDKVLENEFWKTLCYLFCMSSIVTSALQSVIEQSPKTNYETVKLPLVISTSSVSFYKVYVSH